MDLDSPGKILKPWKYNAILGKSSIRQAPNESDLDFYLLKVDGELSCWTRIQRRFMKSIKLHLETKVSQDCRVNELLPNFEWRADPFRGQINKFTCAHIIDKGL